MRYKEKVEPGQEMFDSALWFQWIIATTMGWLLGGLLFGGLAFLISGYVVALSQSFVLFQHFPKAWRWVLLSAVGWTAGWLISFLFIPQELTILSAMVLGLFLGFPQWILLRKEIRWAGWWIPLSLIGWTTAISILPGIFSTGAVAGAIPGAALALLIQHRRLKEQPEDSRQTA